MWSPLVRGYLSDYLLRYFFYIAINNTSSNQCSLVYYWEIIKRRWKRHENRLYMHIFQSSLPCWISGQYSLFLQYEILEKLVTSMNFKLNWKWSIILKTLYIAKPFSCHSLLWYHCLFYLFVGRPVSIGSGGETSQRSWRGLGPHYSLRHSQRHRHLRMPGMTIDV